MRLEAPPAAGFSAVSTAAGFLSITVSNVRAGASGVLRPPSQCLIASRLKPNVSENFACVMPNRLRIALTSTSWGTYALNPSCSPARNASTSLRPSIICSNCVFMLPPVGLENTIGTFLQRVALRHRQVSFLIFRKNRDEKNRKPFVTPDIHNPRPATLSHSFACNPDLSKSASSADHVSTLRVCRNECYDVRTLLLAKELAGNGEVSGRLDDRLHNVCCTPLDTIGSSGIVCHWTPRILGNSSQKVATPLHRELRMDLSYLSSASVRMCTM